MKSLGQLHMDVTKLNLTATSRYWNEKAKQVSRSVWNCEDAVMSKTKKSDHFDKSLKTYYGVQKNHDICGFQSPEAQKSIIYTRKIRVFITTEQKLQFNQYIGASRWVYNKANSIVKTQYENRRKAGGKIKWDFLTKTYLRKAVGIRNYELTPENKWLRDIPYDTRDYAIDDLIAAYKSNFELNKCRENKIFDVKYKTKKNCNEIFKFPCDSLNLDKMKIFPYKSKKQFMVRKRDLEFVKLGADKIVTCVKTKPDKWYLCIPRVRNIPIYESAPYKSVFLDPGVRTFQTGYSPDGVVTKIGHEYSRNYVLPLTRRIDVLESVRSRCDNKITRKNLRNKLFNLRNKIKNRIIDLHRKTCHYLTTNFDTIFLGKLESQSCVAKDNRVISRATVRSLLGLSHYQFRQRLLASAKAKQRGCYVTAENYTTKTCGDCGVTNDIGGCKTYVCPCGYMLDRDIHGARNICIKLLAS